MSPGGPTSPDGHGDSDPPERSLRKDGSLTQERSLRVSSSDDSIALQACGEERDEEEDEEGWKEERGMWSSGGGGRKKVKRREEERKNVGKALDKVETLYNSSLAYSVITQGS